VVERCFSAASKEQRNVMLQQTLGLDSDADVSTIEYQDSQDRLMDLLQDQYGNYVVQNMIEHSDPITRQSILNKLSKVLEGSEVTGHSTLPATDSTLTLVNTPLTITDSELEDNKVMSHAKYIQAFIASLSSGKTPAPGSPSQNPSETAEESSSEQTCAKPEGPREGEHYYGLLQ